METTAKTDTAKVMNVLFLGGAKRVSFGRMLIDAGRKLGIDVRIYSYELEAEVPIAKIGGVIIGRRWNAPDILDHLHQVVEAYGIKILLPFVDGAISVAGSYLINFPGEVTAPVVNAGKAEVLFDKIMSARLFEEAGIDIPPTYKGGRPQFPLIAKPRRGSASKGIKVINTISEFRSISSNAGEYIVQTYYGDIEEFTVDCYIGRNGDVLCVSPRRRLEVIGGEVSKTVTVADALLIEKSIEIIGKLDLKGAVTLQFLRNLADGSVKLMEINPRLGGGVVCTIHAGGDIPSLILKDALGMETERVRVQPGVMICRYFDEMVFK